MSRQKKARSLYHIRRSLYVNENLQKMREEYTLLPVVGALGQMPPLNHRS